MNIAPDKFIHLKGGLFVLVFAAMVAMVMLWLHMHPMAIVVVVAGWVAGLSVEGSQKVDNDAGNGRHEVSFWDALATASPCMIAGALIQLAHHHGHLAFMSRW